MGLALRISSRRTVCTAVVEYQADILASAFNATKLRNKIIVHCAVIRTKLFSKSGQVQRNVVVTAVTVSRDLVSVLDALTNRSVSADVAHSALLSDGNYNRNETETNHIFPYSRRAI